MAETEGVVVAAHHQPPTRRERFEAQPFDALIALMALLAGVAFLADPHPDDAVVEMAYQQIPWLGYAFALLLVTAGGLLLAGIFTLRKDWRIAGLAFMAGAVVLQGTAITIVVGDIGTVSVTLALYLAVVAAALTRARTLIAGRDVRIVEVASS